MHLGQMDRCPLKHTSIEFRERRAVGGMTLYVDSPFLRDIFRADPRAFGSGGRT